MSRDQFLLISSFDGVWDRFVSSYLYYLIINDSTGSEVTSGTCISVLLNSYFSLTSGNVEEDKREKSYRYLKIKT